MAAILVLASSWVDVGGAVRAPRLITTCFQILGWLLFLLCLLPLIPFAWIVAKSYEVDGD
jgi:hypothetical protein